MRFPMRFPRRSSTGTNLVLLAASLAFAVLLGEVALRLVLAGDSALSVKVRKAHRFADYSYEDTYWLLLHRWQELYEPPRHPHPTLGWLASANAETLLHDDTASLHDSASAGARRPVLLYGDSCAQTVPQAESFQEILNRDPELRRDAWLLNYGVGGYGLDQIHLLFEASVDHYEDPFVVLSLLTFDLDRSMLSVRVGQKPYFQLVDGKLELRGVPVESDARAFFDAHPPRVTSYLWRLLLYARDRPGPLLRWIRGEDEKLRKKKALNRAILEKTVAGIRARGLDHVFLVFHPLEHYRDGPDWRDAWLREVLDEMGVPTIHAADALRAAAPDAGIDELFVPENNHPTTLYNRVVAAEIKRHVQASGGR